MKVKYLGDKWFNPAFTKDAIYEVVGESIEGYLLTDNFGYETAASKSKFAIVEEDKPTVAWGGYLNKGYVNNKHVCTIYQPSYNLFIKNYKFNLSLLSDDFEITIAQTMEQLKALHEMLTKFLKDYKEIE
jgi:hypothetical protein